MQYKKKTIDEMNKELFGLGMKERYFPYQEYDSNTIVLQTRRTVNIKDGTMSGSAIALRYDNVWEIWTNQKNKAVRIAKENGFSVRKLDKEVVLFIPAAKSDGFLKMFGAKTKRKISEAGMKVLRANALKTIATASRQGIRACFGSQLAQKVS